MTTNAKRLLLSPIIGVVTAWSVAAAPSARPDAPPSPTTQGRPFARDARGYEGGRPFLGEGRMRPGITPSADEIRAAESFIGEHSPNHYKVYLSVVPERLHNRMQASIVQGYVELKAVEAADPELYKMKLEQIALQDKIFGIAFHLGEVKPAERQTLREQLRPLERDVIRLRKAEAEHRLRRLADAIEKEKSRLTALEAADGSSIDAMVEQDLDRNGRNPAIFGGPFRNGPPSGPPPTTGPAIP